MIVHLPLHSTPFPKTVLVVGGGDSGVHKEIVVENGGFGFVCKPACVINERGPLCMGNIDSIFSDPNSLWSSPVVNRNFTSRNESSNVNIH